jgi:hypothetical protein
MILGLGAWLGAASASYAQPVAAEVPQTAPAAVVASPGVSATPATLPSDAPTTAPTTSPATQPAPSPLIQSLSSADAHDRQRAAAELVKLGEPARTMLAQLLTQTTDLDVITRVNAIIAQLDEDRMTGPSYITLHVKDAPAKDVAEALGKQAFATLRAFPENLWDDNTIPKVTLDLDHQPFWTAMRQFTAQTGLDLQPYNDGPRLMRGIVRAHGCEVIDGPFLIVATQVARSETVQLGVNGARRSDFSMQMTAFAEPKIVAVQGGTMLDINEAVDDAGNSLVGNPAERRMFSFGGVGTWQLFARLAWPQHPGKRIKKIACSTSFTIQTKSQQFEIDDIINAKAKTQILGGTQISFDGISKNGDLWELRLSTNTPNPFQQLMQDRLKLTDAQGHQLDRRGMNESRTNNQATYKLLFAAGRANDGSAVGDPARFVWEIPLETKAIPVKFEFDDLPMPD